MREVTLIKRNDDYFVPATAIDKEAVKNIKNGEAINCKFTKKRNLPFHRKFFALIKVAYDAFEAPVLEYKGMPVGKNLERFRKELIILAGYYESHVSIKGEVRLDAKSIAFGSMGDETFEDLYSDVIDVILKYVCKGYDDEYYVMIHKGGCNRPAFYMKTRPIPGDDRTSKDVFNLAWKPIEPCSAIVCQSCGEGFEPQTKNIRARSDKLDEVVEEVMGFV